MSKPGTDGILALLHERDVDYQALLWIIAGMQDSLPEAVAERTARAEMETSMIGASEEAEWEALRAVVRVLEARATIGQSILRSQR